MSTFNPYNPTVPTTPLPTSAPTSVNIKGINNGTFGFGMYGAMFPQSMNGPFGTNNSPIPIDQQFPVQISPLYNSPYDNMPAFQIPGTVNNIVRLVNKPIYVDPFMSIMSFK
jgi:hypothetical protein